MESILNLFSGNFLVDNEDLSLESDSSNKKSFKSYGQIKSKKKIAQLHQARETTANTSYPSSLTPRTNPRILAACDW